MAKWHVYRPFLTYFEGEALQSSFPTQRVELTNLTWRVGKRLTSNQQIRRVLRPFSTLWKLTLCKQKRMICLLPANNALLLFSQQGVRKKLPAGWGRMLCIFMMHWPSLGRFMQENVSNGILLPLFFTFHFSLFTFFCIFALGFTVKR